MAANDAQLAMPSAAIWIPQRARVSKMFLDLIVYAKCWGFLAANRKLQKILEI